MTTFGSKMEIGKNGPLIDRNYGHSHAFQWVREIVTNSIQAGADKILFTTEWEAVKERGVHRRLVLDNGEGIPPEKMQEYLNRFGGGGKTLAAQQENMGVGLKSSALPWNKYGMVILSKQGESVSMMWLSELEEGTYGARIFTSEELGGDNEQPTHTVPLHQYIEFRPDGDDVDWCKVYPGDDDGVAVVLLGDDPDQDTVTGDPNREAVETTKYGIPKYLGERFYSLPEGVEIRSLQYENWGDRTTWPSAPAQPSWSDGEIFPKNLVGVMQDDGLTSSKRQHRGGVPLEKRLNESKVNDVLDCGSIWVPSSNGVPGAWLHWWFFEDESGTHGANVTYPLAGYVFESHDGILEVFDLLAEGSKQNRALASRMNKFVKVESVRNRLAVLIEPEGSEDGRTFPDMSRTLIRYASESGAGAADFSWDHWIDAWQDNLPDAVNKAVEDYYDKIRKSADPALSPEDYKRLGARFLSHLRGMFVNRKVADKDGSHSTTSSESSTKSGTKKGSTVKKRSVAKKKQSEGDEKVSASEKKVKAGLVGVVFDNLDPDGWVINFDEPNYKAVINRNSEAYKRCLNAILTEKEARKVKGFTQKDREAVIYGVERAMAHIATVAITEALTEARRNPEEAENIMKDWSLSNVLYGIMQIESVASGFIGSYGSKNHLNKVKKADEAA